MNAVAETQRAPVAAPHATHKLKLLLKREFWEHKGGFFWAPVVTGAIASVFASLAMIAGTVLRYQHGVHVNDNDVGDLGRITGAIGDGALLVGVGLAMAVLAFVVFFYALGSLYDDRRDRSILFWKSMPISDTQVVLSKAGWALLLAPLLAVGIGIAIGLAFWVIVALASTVNGMPSASGGILVHSHPFRIVSNILLALPVQILWSLPAVGWLMLCSAWSRRVPFLWAVMAPVMGCAMISFLDVFPGVEIPHGNLWYTVVYRGLLSVVPGAWIPTIVDRIPDMHGPEGLPQVLNLGVSWEVFTHVDVWIGAVAGIAMIVAAIRLRRWRDDN